MEPLRFRTNFFNHPSGYILIKKVYAHFIIFLLGAQFVCLVRFPYSR